MVRFTTIWAWVLATLAIIFMFAYAFADLYFDNYEVIARTTTASDPPATIAEGEPLELPEELKFDRLGEFKVTAYCSCEKCCGKWARQRPKDQSGRTIVYTASGTIATAGRTIAVDPSVIPYGTEVDINGNLYIAEDCGGAIKGNRIDIYFDNHNDALVWGVQICEVFAN